MIPWTTVENALHVWAVAGTGLAADKVIWAQQPGPRPDGVYASLRLVTVRRVGQDWLDVEDAAVPAEGAEIEHKARGVREVLLSVQCFGGIDGAATGTTPAARLDAMVSALTLPSRRDALNAAGVGVASCSAVDSIDGVLGSSVFEPRARFDARMFLASEVSEVGTYVEYVQITNQTTGSVTWVPEEPA